LFCWETQNGIQHLNYKSWYATTNDRLIRYSLGISTNHGLNHQQWYVTISYRLNRGLP